MKMIMMMTMMMMMMMMMVIVNFTSVIQFLVQHVSLLYVHIMH